MMNWTVTMADNTSSAPPSKTTEQPDLAIILSTSITAGIIVLLIFMLVVWCYIKHRYKRLRDVTLSCNSTTNYPRKTLPLDDLRRNVSRRKVSKWSSSHADSFTSTSGLLPQRYGTDSELELGIGTWEIGEIIAIQETNLNSSPVLLQQSHISPRGSIGYPEPWNYYKDISHGGAPNSNYADHKVVDDDILDNSVYENSYYPGPSPLHEPVIVKETSLHVTRPNKDIKKRRLRRADSEFYSDALVHVSRCTTMIQPEQETSQQFIKQQVTEAVRKFLEIPDTIQGTCYASEFFSIGTFGPDGGVLKLIDNELVQLVIPPGALETPQLVYMMMFFENNDVTDETPTVSAQFDCGPDGLQFKVPVELTFPHAAVDTELTVVTKSENDQLYNEDKDPGKPEVLSLTQELMSILIHHFTLYKASFVSRIPVRVNTQGVTRKSGKKLSTSVFISLDTSMAKIYFITNLSSKSLQKTIEETECKRGFHNNKSGWKDFFFEYGKGGLVIEATMSVGDGTNSTYQKFKFYDNTILTTTHKCVELMADRKDLVLYITFYQTAEETDSTQFCVKLDELNASHCDSITNPHWDFHQQYQKMTRVSLMPLTKICVQKEVPSLISNMIRPERVEPIRSSPGGRVPIEHCDHHGGACGCPAIDKEVVVNEMFVNEGLAKTLRGPESIANTTESLSLDLSRYD